MLICVGALVSGGFDKAVETVLVDSSPQWFDLSVMADASAKPHRNFISAELELTCDITAVTKKASAASAILIIGVPSRARVTRI